MEESKHLLIAHCTQPQDLALSICSHVNASAMLCCVWGISPIFTCGNSGAEFITCLFVAVGGWSQATSKGLFVLKCIIHSLASVHMGLQGQVGMVNEYSWPNTENKEKSKSCRVRPGGTVFGLSVREWRGVWGGAPTQLQSWCHVRMGSQGCQIFWVFRSIWISMKKL